MHSVGMQRYSLVAAMVELAQDALGLGTTLDHSSAQ